MDNKIVAGIIFNNSKDEAACGDDDRVVTLEADEDTSEIDITFRLKANDPDSNVTLSFDAADFKRRISTL